MKKRIVLLAMCLALLTVPCFALEGSQSSGSLTSDGLVCQNCFLVGVQLITDGTNDATLILYDNRTAATGTALANLHAYGGQYSATRTFPIPPQAVAGIYADVTGNNASYIVQYYQK